MFHFFKFSDKDLRSKSGFTLLELLVSIAIMTIIITVVVLNQGTYTEENALSNMADDIGLRIFQAQTYGVSVKETTTGSNTFNSAFGLAFDTADKTSFISFVDKSSPRNYLYDGSWSCTSGDLECIEKVVAKRGNVIEKACYETATDYECNGKLYISFARPKIEAILTFKRADGIPVLGSDIINTRIVLKSPKGSYRSVIVNPVGNVSINNTSGPSCQPPGTTFSCNQWSGSSAGGSGTGNSGECTKYGCTWNPHANDPLKNRCNGGNRSCNTLASKSLCSSINAGCYWQ